MDENLPDLSPARAEAIRRNLVSYVTEEPDRQASRRQRRVTMTVFGGLFFTSILTTAGLVVFHPAPVSDKTIVHCMNQDMRDESGELPGSSATLFNDFGPSRVDDAVGLCSAMWKSGALEPGVNPTQVPAEGMIYSIPPLVVCVDQQGAAVVVPSANENICISLRLIPIADGQN